MSKDFKLKIETNRHLFVLNMLFLSGTKKAKTTTCNFLFYTKYVAFFRHCLSKFFSCSTQKSTKPLIFLKKKNVNHSHLQHRRDIKVTGTLCTCNLSAAIESIFFVTWCHVFYLSLLFVVFYTVYLHSKKITDSFLSKHAYQINHSNWNAFEIKRHCLFFRVGLFFTLKLGW